jgi:two-component system nitrate/nitrite response regulator NarL
MEDRLRILLVDDHTLFRRGLEALLAERPDVEVVGEASNGVEAVTAARESVPEVILMDVHMPLCDGLEAVSFIKREMPHVQIIMLTVSDDDRDLFTAIRNGASGYLLKNLEPDQLFKHLDRVRRGEAAITGTMAAKILQELRELAMPTAPETEPAELLTPREIEVLQCIVEGATNRQIAEALCITENTVKIHLRNILEKLHLQNRIQAAVYAVRAGLVDES